MRLIGLLCVLVCCVAAKKRYDGYQVLEIYPKDESEIEHLHSMRHMLDFWKKSSKVGKPFHVMLSPTEQSYMKELFPQHKVMIDNLQSVIDEEEAELARRTVFEPGMPSQAITVDQYHTYPEIVAYLQSLPTTYPDIATLINLGLTYENNTLYGIKLGKSTGSTKKAFWLDANIHAREWIAGASAVWMINELTTKYASNAQYKQYLDTIDIYIIPILNPDGFIYSHNQEREWRKTRSYNCALFSCCYGVDPNRNWPYQWDGAGANNVPCSDEYAGPSAASEKCVQNAINFIKSHPEIQGYMNVHSYSEEWFYPYAYAAKTYPPNKNTLVQMSQQAVAAIKAVHGVSYEYGTPADILYPASGSTFDWTTADANVPFSFGAELRPDQNSPYGFNLPANQIVPTSEEFWAGVQIIVQKVMTL